MITRLRQRVEDEAATALLASQRELKSAYEQKIREARETANNREKLVREEVEKLKNVIKKLLALKSGSRQTEVEAIEIRSEEEKEEVGVASPGNNSNNNSNNSKTSPKGAKVESSEKSGKEDFSDLEATLDSSDSLACCIFCLLSTRPF